MDSVTVQNAPVSAGNLLSIPAVRQVLTMVAIAASVALGVLVIMWTQTPDYNVVYANLDDAQAAEIVAALDAAGIPYRMEGGGTVTVPSKRVYEARMKLATENLPSDTGSGLDMLQEEPGFGVSQFLEIKRYNHALEAELARTISKLKPVKSTRVHIAKAKESVFVRDQKATTASVMLDVLSGQRLEKEQVDSIASFLARSVNGLDVENVTVVDQYGRMLNSPDDADEYAMSAKQFEHTRRLEQSLINSIEELLSPIVGMGKVRAKVVADLDFTASEETQEVYDPDQTAVRSETTRTKERRGDANQAAGIPGALTNQPPVGGNNAAPANPEDELQPINTEQDAMRNYELSRTVRSVRQPTGEIRKLSVAVIVDDRQTLDEEGAVLNNPRTEEELAQINALVREAVGFDEARGDTLQVVNSSFETIDMGEPPAEPKLWETPLFRDLLKQGLGVALVLMLFFGALRPMSRSLIQAASAPQLAYAGAQAGANGQMLDVEEAGSVAALPTPESVPVETRIDNARKLASENPETMAGVVKEWVAEDG